MRKIVIIAMLTVIVVAGGYFVSKNKPANQDGQEVVPTMAQMVGGDRDEHGCIGSAGYSWCGLKNKCIRIWEEDCEAWQKIKEALIKKDKLGEEVEVVITKEDAKYARGTVSRGMFLAAKIDDQWQIVYSGNGSIDCAKIKSDYEFPAEMLVGFCD